MVERVFSPYFPPLKPRYILWSGASYSPKNTVVSAALWGSVQLKEDLGTRAEQCAHRPDAGFSAAPPLLEKHANRSILVLGSSSNILTMDVVFQFPGYQVKEAKDYHLILSVLIERKAYFPLQLVNTHMAF